MRIDVKTGKIILLRVYPMVDRVCVVCDSVYTTRKVISKNRPGIYCSKSCALKRRVRTKIERTVEERRAINTRNKREWNRRQHKKTKPMKQEIIKPIKFVHDETKWAIETYSYCRMKGIIPRGNSDEYGLYKYGEYLTRGEKFDSEVCYE